MKAIGYQTPGPLTETGPAAGHYPAANRSHRRDLLVKVRAVSVNPVDTKVRKAAAPEPGQWKVLGWDAVGEVVATGAEVTGFRPGDQVYYAGSITRPGSNAEFHLVDERIVGRKPRA